MFVALASSGSLLDHKRVISSPGNAYVLFLTSNFEDPEPDVDQDC